MTAAQIAERNHQGLGNRLIERVPVRKAGTIRRRQPLGGLLNYYDGATVTASADWCDITG